MLPKTIELHCHSGKADFQDVPYIFSVSGHVAIILNLTVGIW